MVVVVVVCVVVVVLSEGLTLATKIVDFRRKNVCFFVSRPMKIVTLSADVRLNGTFS